MCFINPSGAQGPSKAPGMKIEKNPYQFLPLLYLMSGASLAQRFMHGLCNVMLQKAVNHLFNSFTFVIGVSSSWQGFKNTFYNQFNLIV